MDYGANANRHNDRSADNDDYDHTANHKDENNCDTDTNTAIHDKGL